MDPRVRGDDERLGRRSVRGNDDLKPAGWDTSSSSRKRFFLSSSRTRGPILKVGSSSKVKMDPRVRGDNERLGRCSVRGNDAGLRLIPRFQFCWP